MSLCLVRRGLCVIDVLGEGGLLGKRPEDEFTLGDANVRNLETLVVELEVLVEEDIKVDVSGSLVYEFLAAQ